MLLYFTFFTFRQFDIPETTRKNTTTFEQSLENRYKHFSVLIRICKYMPFLCYTNIISIIILYCPKVSQISGDLRELSGTPRTCQDLAEQWCRAMVPWKAMALKCWIIMASCLNYCFFLFFFIIFGPEVPMIAQELNKLSEEYYYYYYNTLLLLILRNIYFCCSSGFLIYDVQGIIET